MHVAGVPGRGSRSAGNEGGDVEDYCCGGEEGFHCFGRSEGGLRITRWRIAEDIVLEGRSDCWILNVQHEESEAQYQAGISRCSYTRMGLLEAHSTRLAFPGITMGGIKDTAQATNGHYLLWTNVDQHLV